MAARCEEQLVGYLERARAAGLIIVSDAFEVRDALGVAQGCCALGAYNLFADGEPLPLPEQALVIDGPCPFREAWDAIEFGFDGIAAVEVQQSARLWHAVGARLRERFQPVPASTLEGAS